MNVRHSAFMQNTAYDFHDYPKMHRILPTNDKKEDL